MGTFLGGAAVALTTTCRRLCRPLRICDTNGVKPCERGEQRRAPEAADKPINRGCLTL